MTPLAATRDLVIRFGGLAAVDGVTLTVDRGEVVGLLGANGAGKTTLIRCLLGLITPTSGEVELLGGPPDRDRLRKVGYLPQSLGLYPDLTIAENLAFRRGIFGSAPATLDAELESRRDVVVGDLSLGLQRRTAFAAALAHRPELLVLDEPTSGVGPLARAQLWDTIRTVAESGGGVLVTTHHLEEAEQCDRLVMLASGGVVAAGSIDDVIAGRTAIEVEGEVGAVLAALDRVGITASISAGRARVFGGDARQVEAAVAGLGVHLATVPATLEEAFVALVATT